MTVVVVHVHLHLAQVLMGQLVELQVNDEVAAQEAVVENEVQEVVLAVEGESFLPGLEEKTLAQLDEKPLQVGDDGRLQIGFRIAGLLLQAQELEDESFFQEVFGAGDDLARGQSTFLVEMNETALILHNATEDSLVILDEIGRGTSTLDGLSIAWAVGEHLHDKVKAKTLFATHYHDLTELALTRPGVRNFRVDVREEKDRVVFLRRIVEGGADRSYGIQVARLAGLPGEVLQRAEEILKGLEAGELNAAGKPARIRPKAPKGRTERPKDELDLFA